MGSRAHPTIGSTKPCFARLRVGGWFSIDKRVCMVYVPWVMASRLWVAKHDRLGWVDPLGRRQALCRGSNGRGPDRMRRSCFRVSSMGTDVAGVAAARVGPVGRCVSIADGSLSLSLSLSTPGLVGKKPSVGAGLGACNDLPAGHRRAPGCGTRVARRRRGACPLLACARVAVDLGRLPCTPGVASKGAKALVPSRVWFPGRRGSLSGRGAHLFCGLSAVRGDGLGLVLGLGGVVQGFERSGPASFLRGRGLDRRFNSASCWPISDRSRPSHTRRYRTITIKETR